MVTTDDHHAGSNKSGSTIYVPCSWRRSGLICKSDVDPDLFSGLITGHRLQTYPLKNKSGSTSDKQVRIYVPCSKQVRIYVRQTSPDCKTSPDLRPGQTSPIVAGASGSVLGRARCCRCSAYCAAACCCVRRCSLRADLAGGSNRYELRNESPTACAGEQAVDGGKSREADARQRFDGATAGALRRGRRWLQAPSANPGCAHQGLAAESQGGQARH